MDLLGIRNIYTCHAVHLMPCILNLVPYTSNLVPLYYGQRTDPVFLPSARRLTHKFDKSHR